MAKVVTSQGLTDFVATGTPTETIAREERKPPGAAPPVEMKANTPAADPPEHAAEAEPKADAKADPKAETGLEPDDHDLADKAKRRIAKKHYEMRVAQEEAAAKAEEAAENERLAESLFNERELWRKRAEAAEAKTAEPKADPVPQLPIKQPDESDPKYRDAQGNFKLKDFVADTVNFQKETERREAEQKAQQDALAKQKARDEKLNREASERIEKAKRTKYKDWDSVVPTSTTIFPYLALDYMRQSDYGPDLAYFLASNKASADKIAAMDPVMAIAELRDIETQFRKPADKPTAAPKTVEPQGAPPPITPISTSGVGTTNTDPARMSFQELRAYRREQARERSRR